ncbi:2-amino-4-hydroxy-6-hydroxymethyldihydropteridine diphosphokinase [Deinococcus puniceus]|uniref:2-amino-4-hydroxy-6-hydroxymethyldihydropteridine diphosphokinase n=1 Tax=Deinococcus puniceus TaxID=1182568 RepID=A0A172T787_9DEIO|nr:2-amino-4-hydroxy-6-hydroxymethyldihydropteridine diphosphokinase [Deinococcus puniceus]ANE42817.1 2-amino-4-hydroxy-6-hydroxymethyldihydropteridine pyrophosphokinase [Deinococcus puniceus]
MQTAWIALGANLGEARQTLQWARAELAQLGTVTGASALYRTAPVGGPPGQPDYLNAALTLHTRLPAPALLAALHTLEARAGRERRERWEARILDLDLILYGDLVMETPSLTLPHPRAWQRAFVLAPLADLDPLRRHPDTGESVAEALERVGRDGVFRETSDW